MKTKYYVSVLGSKNKAKPVTIDGSYHQAAMIFVKRNAKLMEAVESGKRIPVVVIDKDVLI